ncbi:hypothetical protein [Nocardia callitridis]|uniref:Uncharacterized protein n=1 Tax=Nocardia callitridis TaxID=648753 RepID=A0ABP9KFB1_9NOCA
MVKKFRQRWQLSRVRPGDGSALPEYRLWQLFARSLFFLELTDHTGRGDTFAVDVRYLADAKTRKQHENGEGKSPVALYRNGFQVARANLPATFPVAGGVIEVATSSFGLKRIRFVSEDGDRRALHPHHRSQEGLRARFDKRFSRTSAVVGVMTVVILLGALVLGLLQGAEALTRSAVIAAHIGTFVSPIHLSGWANVAIGVAAALSAMERATRLKYHWLIDGAAS